MNVGRKAADRITGTWETDDGDRLDLSFDGDRAITGVISAGRPDNPVAIRNGAFDRTTGALRLEGEARRPDHSAVVPFVIDGALRGRSLHVTYRFGEDRGSAILSRASRWLTLRRHFSTAADRGWLYIEPAIVPVARAWRSLRRPSKPANARRLRERGESTASLIFRDASPEDLPALAALHVKTWSATYPGVRHPPTFEVRERQWQDAFAQMNGSWFCIVVQNTAGELVGFAKGVKRAGGVGDLNKIYLLGDYQRLGLGRRLVGHVARRFLSEGSSSMTLLADAANPSCRFYLALGAENTREPGGRLNRGSFVWRDLEKLASICPEEPVER